MNLTKSLCCRRLCFTNAVSCPHCGQAFEPGALSAKALGEDQAFDRKAHALFLATILLMVAVIFFVFRAA
jgi:hypothetical protein